MAIICSEMQSVFLEEKSRTTVSYEEQITLEVYSQIFPFFSPSHDLRARKKYDGLFCHL